MSAHALNDGRIHERNARNQTGCVGISIVRSASGRRDGTVLTYFSAHARLTSGRNGRRVNRKFCINSLGRQEAWRRALKFRAKHEVRAARALAVAAALSHRVSPAGGIS